MEGRRLAHLQVLGGSGLKMITIMTMLINHVDGMMIKPGILRNHDVSIIMNTPELFKWIQIDTVLRTIGRLTFPIFCFSIMEGFLHTRDVKEHALRLLAFSFLSEIPFNLDLFGTVFNAQYRNVYFTLFLGLLALIGLQKYQKSFWKRALALMACRGAAVLLRTDYDAFGVFFIALLYLLRDNKMIQTLLGCIGLYQGAAGTLAFIPINMYNGSRGKWNLKCLFYALCLTHILVLWGIHTIWLGQAGAGETIVFDTHVHYDDKALGEDREQLLESLWEDGVEAVVNIGASIRTTQNTLELVEKYPFVYGAVGAHPSDTGELDERQMEWLREVSARKKVVTIGEIGSDYHWDESDKAIRKHQFIRWLELAREVKLPVVIHSRGAAKDTLDIVKEEKAQEIGGAIHCFSYGVGVAREHLDMGFYLGIGGVLTFRNAKKLKEVVAYMPMDRIVLKTNCPYLAPMPNRGKRNSSLNLSYMVGAISSIKDIPAEGVIEITNRNAKEMYRLA